MQLRRLFAAAITISFGRLQTTSAGACSDVTYAFEAPEVHYDRPDSTFRSDVREDEAGVPVEFFVTVIGPDCDPVAGAFVDLWQANANGVYSGFSGDDPMDMGHPSDALGAPARSMVADPSAGMAGGPARDSHDRHRPAQGPAVPSMEAHAPDHDAQASSMPGPKTPQVMHGNRRHLAQVAGRSGRHLLQADPDMPSHHNGPHKDLVSMNKTGSPAEAPGHNVMAHAPHSSMEHAMGPHPMHRAMGPMHSGHAAGSKPHAAMGPKPSEPAGNASMEANETGTRRGLADMDAAPAAPGGEDANMAKTTDLPGHGLSTDPMQGMAGSHDKPGMRLAPMPGPCKHRPFPGAPHGMHGPHHPRGLDNMGAPMMDGADPEADYPLPGAPHGMHHPHSKMHGMPPGQAMMDLPDCDAPGPDGAHPFPHGMDHLPGMGMGPDVAPHGKMPHHDNRRGLAAEDTMPGMAAAGPTRDGHPGRRHGDDGNGPAPGPDKGGGKRPSDDLWGMAASQSVRANRNMPSMMAPMGAPHMGPHGAAGGAGMTGMPMPGQMPHAGGPMDNSTFLRGVLATNASGVAAFETIFPGHAAGHMPPHINVKVRIPQGAAASMEQAFKRSMTVYTGHIFMADNLTREVYTTSADYRRHAPGPMPHGADGMMGQDPGAMGSYPPMPPRDHMPHSGSGPMPMHPMGFSDAPEPQFPGDHSGGHMGGPHRDGDGGALAAALGPMPPGGLHHAAFLRQTATYSYVTPGKVDGGLIMNIVLKVHDTPEPMAGSPSMAMASRGGDGVMSPPGDRPPHPDPMSDRMPVG